MPELVGKWFSKEPILPLQSSSSAAASGGNPSVSIDINQADSTDSWVDATASPSSNDVETSDPSNDQIGYCYCGNREDYDDMICCDNKECLIKWFHFSCLQMTKKMCPN